MPDDQEYKDARKQTFRMCRAYASILGERLAKPLQKIKPDPEARHLLSSVASRSKLLEAFDNELSLEPTLGLAQVIGLEEYAEEGSSDEEESSVDEKSLANKDISNEEILCAEKERGIIGGQDAEERYDAEERIAGEPSKD
jgi:hypothetical protein